ncbi:MAG: endonuclease V, partial [Planctomycetota bacterium]
MFHRRGKIAPDQLAAWKAEQARLRAGVVERPLGDVRLIAGADCAFLGDDVLAAAVLWDVETKTVVAEATVRRAVTVPYIPGYLGFREAPAVLEALGQLPRFDAVLCDGQGIAHPRRCGLAVHVGVTLGKPCVGVAKSRLLGDHDEPADTRGATAPLLHDGERIGSVLRTRVKVKPLFVSVGQHVNLTAACALVMRCQTRYR